MGDPSLALLLLLLHSAMTAAPVLLCDSTGCTCTPIQPFWINVSCTFNDSRLAVEVEPGSLPPNVQELRISTTRELRLLPNAFSRLRDLSLVYVQRARKLIVRTDSFLELATHHLLFRAEDCGQVVVETHAFWALRGPVTALIMRASRLVIHAAAFSSLLNATLTDILHLELMENAFLLESNAFGHQGPFTKISLERVTMSDLPGNAFPSPMSELQVKDSSIQSVRNNAVSGMQLTSVLVYNTTVSRIQTAAFNPRTLIYRLEFNRVQLDMLEANAILSGITQLEIHHSRLSEVMSGAINTTVANVTLNENIFERIHSKGFSLNEWNSIDISNNKFKNLGYKAFSAPFHPNSELNHYEFIFVNNVIVNIEEYALDFDLSDNIDFQITDNIFVHTCRCELNSWLSSRLSGSVMCVDKLFNTSLCMVNYDLAKCFKMPVGFVNMLNFTVVVCGPENVIRCDTAQLEAGLPPHITGIISTVDIDLERDLDRERKILGSIFVFVVCGMIIMLFLSSLMWLHRNGYCTKARLLLLPSTFNSLLNFLSRFFITSGPAAAGSAHSISRVSVHEYAELQRQKLQEEEQAFPSEDKATQTLPEELTQELLQSLREKLDDPDNYSEARDMIEHLYDLIKVEESCNQNYHMDATSINLEELDEGIGENVYDVIRPTKLKQYTATKPKILVSVGTRAPSPDKLQPLAGAREERRPTLLCEYVEPRDREHHVYMELPDASAAAPMRRLSFLRTLSQSVLPASVLCDYAEPNDTAIHVYSELPANMMVNRPLPDKPDRELGEGPSTTAKRYL